MGDNPKVSQHSLIRDYFRRIGMFSRNARLFLSATALWGFAAGIWVVLFNLYLLDLGFREDFIGYILLSSGIIAGLAAFPAGIVCDKIGRKKSLLIGVMAGSVFNAILSCLACCMSLQCVLLYFPVMSELRVYLTTGGFFQHTVQNTLEKVRVHF